MQSGAVWLPRSFLRRRSKFHSGLDWLEALLRLNRLIEANRFGPPVSSPTLLSQR